MKKFLIFCFIVLTSLNGYAQEGAYKGGNYSGIHGVFSNPAHLASNYRKWDINLFSLNATVANDSEGVSISDIGNLDELEDRLFHGEEHALSGVINMEVTGPSFMFRVSPKHSFAFTTRTRLLGNIQKFDTKLIEAIRGAKDISSLPYTLTTGNQKFTVNSWSEIGASWGGGIYINNQHSFKGGVSLKYLRGVGNSFVVVDNLYAKLDTEKQTNGYEKPYLTDGSGKMTLVNSGIDLFGDLKVSDLTKSNGNGIGVDLGFVYEYKNTDDTINWCNNCPNNGYKFKLGVSVTDLGKIKYKTVENNSFAYNLLIPSGGKFYIDDLDGSIEEMQKYLNTSPYATKNVVNNDYSPSLPTMLNFMADYYWGHNFFTEISGRFSLVDNERNAENGYYYNSMRFTPRFENKYWGIYLPFSYNTISDFNVGLTLRMGPLLIGSGSIITNLIGEAKQVDIFVGIRFGGV